MAREYKATAVPLEANPDSFNKLAADFGLDTASVCFHDVLGFDDELLALIPQPVKAVVLLYPGFKNTMYREQQDVQGSVDRASLVHFRQLVMNQCGTMALLHCLANTPDLPLRDGPIKQLFANCKGIPMDDAAAKLDESDISALHTAAALIGQSETPPADIHPEGAFCGFVEQNGNLIELDGWTEQPRLHGPIEGSLIKSVIRVVKEIMTLRDGSCMFTLLALAPASAEP
ncbi:cysteine proteinase [Auricularia subglabra TFB-10046 SS5]|nr:cysteine proteinase [Auricularia subglabra TFB-10046 SS5]